MKPQWRSSCTHGATCTACGVLGCAGGPQFSRLHQHAFLLVNYYSSSLSQIVLGHAEKTAARPLRETSINCQVNMSKVRHRASARHVGRNPTSSHHNADNRTPNKFNTTVIMHLLSACYGRCNASPAHKTMEQPKRIPILLLCPPNRSLPLLLEANAHRLPRGDGCTATTEPQLSRAVVARRPLLATVAAAIPLAP